MYIYIYVYVYCTGICTHNHNEQKKTFDRESVRNICQILSCLLVNKDPDTHNGLYNSVCSMIPISVRNNQC